MNNNFPRTLSLLRKEKRISQRTAAAELGVSQAVLSHYENGVREPGLDFVARAADYYHVSADFLLGRTMSREDHTISAEDIPDVNDMKDNVMRGSVFASMSKKLIINSLSVLFDIIGKSKNKKVIQDVAMYMYCAVYRVFRHLYTAKGENAEEFFSASDIAWQEATDALMSISEMRFKAGISDKKTSVSKEKPEKNEIPQLTAELLKEEYPERNASLMSVLQAVAKEIDEYL